jgi:hypothetical protein
LSLRATSEDNVGVTRTPATQQHQILPASTPFVELGRSDWARLADRLQQPLNTDDVERLAGLGERLDLAEVAEVYLPLSRLLSLYVEGTGHLHSATSRFLGETTKRTPFVIGVAGSVAVGKSTTARVLQELLRRWPGMPKVDLVTTDGFLFPNAELIRRGILDRKGFPESYDQRSLLRFITAVKSGTPGVVAPKYSHLTYDILKDADGQIDHAAARDEFLETFEHEPHLRGMLGTASRTNVYPSTDVNRNYYAGNACVPPDQSLRSSILCTE